MIEFKPPRFEPHRVYRGGHLQTVLSVAQSAAVDLDPTAHVVAVSDGDSVVLHEDCSSDWQPGDGAMLLIHGLTGCHQASYMLRLAHLFVAHGLRVYRMDLRGCGAAMGLNRNVTHAGRSDDLNRVLAEIARQTGSGPLMAMGVSLGGNQLLRLVSRVGAGLDSTPDWFERLSRIAVVAPPIDLQKCSENMSRWSRRIYNYYFIRGLLGRTSEQVKSRAEYQQFVNGPRPRTLFELDDRLTAPLSGFDGARAYYATASCHSITRANRVPTLVLAAVDDPIVPIGCFTDDADQWPKTTTLHLAETGGHVGFIDRQRKCWMDRAAESWFTH